VGNRAALSKSELEVAQIVWRLGDFVNRLFDGDALPLMRHLINDRGLSEQEIDQLQQTLDELKRRKRS
jgi:predicted transcriptional regulator